MYRDFDFKSLSKVNAIFCGVLYVYRNEIAEHLALSKYKVLQSTMSLPLEKSIDRCVDFFRKKIFFEKIAKKCRIGLDFLDDIDRIVLVRYFMRKPIVNLYKTCERIYFKKRDKALAQFGYELARQGINNNYLRDSKLLQDFSDFLSVAQNIYNNKLKRKVENGKTDK